MIYGVQKVVLLRVRDLFWVTLMFFSVASFAQDQDTPVTYHPLAISSSRDFAQQESSFDAKMAQTKEHMEQTFYDEAKVRAYEKELENLDYELPGPIDEGDEIVLGDAWVAEDEPFIEIRE